MSKPTVFISYKTGNRNNTEVGTIFNFLTKNSDGPHFAAFWDKERLSGGSNWETEITKNIEASDVLMVIITADILDSNGDPSFWVKREVDYARICHIPVLPVRIYPDENVTPVLQALDISAIQMIDAPNTIFKIEERCHVMVIAIKKLFQDSVQVLEYWINYLSKRKKRIDYSDPRNLPVKPLVPQRSTFRYKLSMVNDWHDCKIHLAAGNIVNMEKVDVLVNSENNYMQMGRIFDTNTVSSNLRYAAAGFDEDGLMDDWLQRELDKQVKNRKEPNQEFIRPVPARSVLVTGAGHPTSALVTVNKIRYIFHVASVTVDDARALKKLDNPDSLKACVANCLNQIAKVNSISHANSPNHQDIKSIVFPLLGSGTGGAPVDEAAQAMIDSIKRWMEENPVTTLQEIYICAFLLREVEMVESVLNQNFTRQ